MAALRKNAAQGFAEGGKSSAGEARYRYVLQLSVVGPAGTLFPLMHEEMDVHNPETEKEDCELKSFARLSQRLKKEFPKLPICLVADSLYGCQTIVATCQQFDWKYVLTLKEGRQPTTWDETIRLLPLHRTNWLRRLLGQAAKRAAGFSLGGERDARRAPDQRHFAGRNHQRAQPPPSTPTSPIFQTSPRNAWPPSPTAPAEKGT